MNLQKLGLIWVCRKNPYPIFEFKMNQPAKIAIDQIKEQGYAKPYLNIGKPITLIGLIFSRMERNIVEWLEEELMVWIFLNAGNVDFSRKSVLSYSILP